MKQNIKKHKKLFIILGVVFLIIALAAYPISRYGWKLFGFTLCDTTAFATSVDIDDNFVYLKGYTASSAAAFVGYTYRIKDNTLYVGMKYNILLGFTDRDGSFDIKIPIDNKTIDKIIIKGGSYEEVIYEKDVS